MTPIEDHDDDLRLDLPEGRPGHALGPDRLARGLGVMALCLCGAAFFGSRYHQPVDLTEGPGLEALLDGDDGPAAHDLDISIPDEVAAPAAPAPAPIPVLAAGADPQPTPVPQPPSAAPRRAARATGVVRADQPLPELEADDPAEGTLLGSVEDDEEQIGAPTSDPPMGSVAPGSSSPAAEPVPIDATNDPEDQDAADPDEGD